MFAEKTRKYLEMVMGNVSHADRELQKELKEELSKLEQLTLKQIPAKPKRDELTNSHRCPKCNIKVNRNYCPNCGQSIEWNWG